MDLDQFRQLWQGLPEDSREEIRRQILRPEILERLDQLKAGR
jgi:hypothetical protein